MKTEFSLEAYKNAHHKVFSSLDFESIYFAINLIKSHYKNGSKIITCGNGGSASTASHYITDWQKMVYLATGEKFRGFSLVDNIGLITAYANDVSYDDVFSGQVGSVMNPGDLLICVSGSGNSKNTIKAIEEAKKLQCTTLSIVGYDGGQMKAISDYNVHIKSFDMQVCEDFHLMFGHWVMKSLCSGYIYD
jgi:D-sedoheptulose 7-phosphate isomerase